MLEVSQLHAKRVAVVLRVGDEERVLRGMGSVEDHDVLGEVLRVDSSEDSHILLQGPLDKTAVTSGDAYGCDYCVELSQPGMPRATSDKSDNAARSPIGSSPIGSSPASPSQGAAAAAIPLADHALPAQTTIPAQTKLPPRRLKHPPGRKA